MADPILVARESTEAFLVRPEDEVLRMVSPDLAQAASAVITYFHVQYVAEGYWEAGYTVL